MREPEANLFDQIVFLYGLEKAESIYNRICNRLIQFRETHPELAKSSPDNRVDEKDVILITYADMVRNQEETPLRTLGTFLNKYLKNVISTVHILPFYPYSSDDGFSVIDYYEVNPDFGSWEDVELLGKNFRLMFDAVINHVSAESVWFQGFLRDDPRYRDYFTTVEPGTDLSRVFRPRATPVITPFKTPSGEKLVWTTFSADQIDLNFANPEVLIEVIDILLFFAAHGAEFIRLDAVTFVWKEIGTSCVNSKHTHRIVQTIRTIFDIAAPKIAIITETNVPHKENIAYFGDGTNEAQMVYNFALPFLTLNAFHSKNVSTLTSWACTLDLPSSQATFFNFQACHDGIGLLPIKDILGPSEVNKIADQVKKLGGFVSYKNNEDGSQSPYELNINYLDALITPGEQEMDTHLIAKRFLASQAIMLTLRGVPGIYFHSLFGSRNWSDGVEGTGRYRSINREKLDFSILEKELADPTSLRYHIYSGFQHLLETRKSNPAFHPLGGQQILTISKSLFAVHRSSIDNRDQVLCLTNVTKNIVEVEINLELISCQGIRMIQDLITYEEYFSTGVHLKLELSPFQVMWLQLR